MTNLEYTLGIPELDDKALVAAKDTLTKEARRVLDNKYVQALLTIMRARARAQMQIVMNADDEIAIRVARAKLTGYLQLFSEIALLEQAVNTKELDDGN